MEQKLNNLFNQWCKETNIKKHEINKIWKI